MTSPDPRDDLVNHIGSLRAFAVNLTRNAALSDDLVQDTLEKAWTNMDKFEPGSNLRAWLFTILRNTYYSQYRRRQREVPDDGARAEALSTKPDHDGRLNLRDFRVALNSLPDEQREALILVGAGGFSYEEAAETCGVAVGTIKSRVNRARKRLVEMLDLRDDDQFEITDRVTQGIVAGTGGTGGGGSGGPETGQ